MNWIRSLFGFYDEHPYKTALALVNALTGTTYGTPLRIRHAQAMDARGNVRIYTTDGHEYVLSLVKVR